MDRKPNDQTTAIWVLLNIAHKRVTQTFEAELKHARLPSAAWYDILWALERAEEGMRQNELERQSLFDQPNLSRTIKRMVDDGLVTQCPLQPTGAGVSCGSPKRAKRCGRRCGKSMAV